MTSVLGPPRAWPSGVPSDPIQKTSSAVGNLAQNDGDMARVRGHCPSKAPLLPKLKSIGRRFGRREDLCTPSLHAQDAFSTEYKIPCRRVIESLPIVRLLSRRPVRSKERREQRRARVRDTTQQRATATRGRGEIRPPILATLSALSLSRARGGRAPRPDPRDPSSDDLLSGGKPAGLRLTVASLARAFFAPRALSHTV